MKLVLINIIQNRLISDTKIFMTEKSKVAVLKEILTENDLFENHTSYSFDAKLTITTSIAALSNVDSNIKISTTSGRGYLSIMFSGNAIDYNYFPKEIKVLLKDIEFIDNQYLKISGFNFVNRNIGNYLILIVPL